MITQDNCDTDFFAEEALIDNLYSGAVDAEEATKIYGSIQLEAFTDRRLAVMFEAAKHLHSQAPDLVDSVAAIDYLRKQGRLAEAGGAAHVCEVTSCSGTGANVLHWARTVADQYRRRRLGEISRQAIEAASDPTTPVDVASLAFADAFAELAIDSEASKSRPIRSLLAEEFREIERRYSTGDGDDSISSGFASLDEIVGGFVPGELTILAGRPSMGKTSLSLAFAQNVANSGRFALMFSLEMAAQQIAHRLISMGSSITSRDLRQPRERMRNRWGELAGAIEAAGIDGFDVVDSARVTVADIRAGVKARSSKGVGLVVVDYLQLVRPLEKGHSREREVAEISAELKAIAKDCKVPVVCLAQLNRATEQQSDKMPMLGNLRESGSIEQDADVVLFVHREGYYDCRKPQDRAKIIIAKNRNGATGIAEVGWHGERTLFFDPEDNRGF